MRYNYNITYEGQKYTARTASEAAAILRSLDLVRFNRCYEQDIARYLRGDMYAIRKWGSKLKGVVSKSEVPHITCDYCGKVIYENSTVFSVEGYSTKFCSPGCAGYYFLDIQQSKLDTKNLE